MSRTMMAALLLCALTTTVRAGEGVEKPKTSAADEYKVLVEAGEEDGRSRALAAKFITLAREHRQDPIAVDSLIWVITNMRRGTEVSQAFELLNTEHMRSDKLGDVCGRLVRRPSVEAESLLRTLLAKSPHKDVQAQACFHLAAYLKELRRLSESLKKEPRLKKRFEQFYGSDVTQQLASLDEGTTAAEIERLYARVAKSFADVPLDEGTMGAAAQKELFAIRHLSVGRWAPEITGKGIDGEEFKLSSYRGKVVVLDFWGHW